VVIGEVSVFAAAVAEIYLGEVSDSSVAMREAAMVE